MLTAEQKAILVFARNAGGSFTKAEAVKEFGREYYGNSGSKHEATGLAAWLTPGCWNAKQKAGIGSAKARKASPQRLTRGKLIYSDEIPNHITRP